MKKEANLYFNNKQLTASASNKEMFLESFHHCQVVPEYREITYKCSLTSLTKRHYLFSYIYIYIYK